MDNVVFIQDFPQFTEPLKSTSELPVFAKELYDLLDKMRVPSSVKEELLKYNFEKAKVSVWSIVKREEKLRLD